MEILSGLSKVPSLNGTSDLKGTPSIAGMSQWLAKIGYKAADIDRLNIVHVAGTKGKGSTSAFIDSFLRAHGSRTGSPRKVGLYTSPHLIHPEERIRINFEPLPRDLFAKYFFEVYDALLGDGSQEGLNGIGPRYLQLFALLSFHTFIREGVDAAIYETHHGGEYDTTNVIQRPVVTVITPLGLDHVKQLGPSIENIAWHKAGIFKPGSAAVSAPQEHAAAEVLRSRASEKGVNLQFIEQDLSLPDVPQLKPDVQRTNCSVALAAVRLFLQKGETSTSNLGSPDILQGISQFFWPGRFQLVVEDNILWYLDGAHNEMSITKAAEWFIETSKFRKVTPPVARVLIFSHISDQRDGAAVLERLATSLCGSGIQYAIFTTYEHGLGHGTIMDRELDESSKHAYEEIWKRAHPNTNTLFEPTINEALEAARGIGEGFGSVQVLITGSQYLVGGALNLLNPT